MSNPTVAQQIEEHLAGIEMHISSLRAQMLPVPPSRLVWELGTMCRLAGSRFIGMTTTIEALELEQKLAPAPPDHTEPTPRASEAQPAFLL